VYVTGRSAREGEQDHGLPGTVHATAEAINERGGVGVAVVCDHADDEQVEALFDRIEKDSGRLDVVVSNAIALPPVPPAGRAFWEMPLRPELELLNVGLRSHYVSDYYAARMMVRQREGLIVHTSSPGARTHLPGIHTPPYGAGKAGSDKMVYDIAYELRPYGVAALSIWIGLLMTERIAASSASRSFEGRSGPAPMGGLFPGMETPEFVGRVIDALATDPELMARSGQAFYSSELGEHYGIVDVDGSTPPSYRAWLGAPSEFIDVIPTYSAFRAQQNEA
jgi:NAD(P)-dependent dehydrogenase (short-subunit alcohol dehydrogenase family)